jgi:hypothetical protein
MAPSTARSQETGDGLMPSVALPESLERVLRDYEREWEGRNPEGLAALFTGDGMILPNGRPPVRGRPAIAGDYRNAGGSLRLRALAYAADDTVGYIIGGYRWGTATADAGKFVLALRRNPGGPWMIAADIDNTNRPRNPGS